MWNRLRWELLRVRLWWRRRVVLNLLGNRLGNLLGMRSLRREAWWKRRPSLVIHIRLHLVGMSRRRRRRRRIWILGALGRKPMWRHIGGHVRLILGVVNGGLGHEREAVYWGCRLRNRYLAHSGGHTAHVVPRRWPRSHLRLRSVSSLAGVAWMRRELHAVRDRRRR